jgi:hypothetical protein
MTQGKSGAAPIANSMGRSGPRREVTLAFAAAGIAWRTLLWTAHSLFVALLVSVEVSPSFGQCDLPESRAARKILSRLVSSEREFLDRQFEPIGFTVAELRNELLRGDAASADIVRQAAEIVAEVFAEEREEPPAEAPDVTRAVALSMPRGQELTRRLEGLAEALVLPPPESWRELAEQRAQEVADGPLTSEPNDKSISFDMGELLAEVEQVLSSRSTESNAWRNYWHWEAAQRIASGQPMECHELDELEHRWQATRLLWDHPVVLEAALAMEQTIRLARARLHPESQQERLEAWCEIRDLLAEGEWSEEASWRRLRERIAMREQQGDIHPLTRAIRRYEARENLVVECGRAAFSSWLPLEIRQPYPIRGVFAGSWAEGTGELEGNLDLQFLSSPLAAKWTFRFTGQSSGRTQSWDRRVRVIADASTDLQGESTATWNPWRLAFAPPVVSSQAEVRFRQIDASGTWLRRRLAEQRTLERRRWAERDTQREAEQALREQFSELSEGLREIEQELANRIGRGRWATTRQLAPEVRIFSDSDSLTWQGQFTLTSPSRLTSPRPWAGPCEGIRISVAETAVESYLAANWGGKIWRGESLAPEFTSLFHPPESSAPEPPSGELEVAFGDSPFRIRLDEDCVEVTLQCESLALGGTTYPPLRITIAYQPEVGESVWVWRRLGTPRVQFAAEGMGETPLSGRQQTWRLVAQRRLSRLLPETFQLDSPRWYLTEDQAVQVSVIREQIASGWWQAEFQWTPVARRIDSP